MFDRERKLKARMGPLMNAVRSSGKPAHELIQDPFAGHPFLIQALLGPTAATSETITLDKAVKLLDLYYEKGGTYEALKKALDKCLTGFLHIETTPDDDERDREGELPNGDTPDATGPSEG